jgi:hypothetical protein
MDSHSCFPVGTAPARQFAEEPSVFIGLPVYSAPLTQFVGSLMNALNKVRARVEFGVGDSLVTRSRNNIAHAFMQSRCAYLLFIDTDLDFPAEHIERLVAHPATYPIIGGCYPKKKVGPAEWVANALPGAAPDANGIQEVMELGTGLLRIHRSVFGALREAYPQLRYRCDGAKDIRYDFFPVGTYRDHTYKAEDESRYLSEDWYLCQLARQIGYRIFADTKVTAGHWGFVRYPLDPAAQDPNKAQGDSVSRSESATAQDAASQAAEKKACTEDIPRAA